MWRLDFPLCIVLSLRSYPWIIPVNGPDEQGSYSTPRYTPEFRGFGHLRTYAGTACGLDVEFNTRE